MSIFKDSRQATRDNQADFVAIAVFGQIFGQKLAKKGVY
jgi:hypothetical protein